MVDGEAGLYRVVEHEDKDEDEYDGLVFRQFTFDGYTEEPFRPHNWLRTARSDTLTSAAWKWGEDGANWNEDLIDPRNNDLWRPEDDFVDVFEFHTPEGGYCA